MNRNLLYVVQRVQEKLDLDVVNSINDSPDAILIAREAEDTYYDLINRNEWPQRYDLIGVESVGDVNNPSALRLSVDTLKIASLRYDVTEIGKADKCYRELIQLDPEEFLDRVYSRNSSDENITVANYEGTELYIYNDQAPTFFTTFDNEYIVLDAWDSAVETTAQGVKAVVRGSSIPLFEMSNTYIVPVDVTTFPLYLAEVTAAASHSLNGAADPENERRRNRGISRLRNNAIRTEKLDTRNKFGRVGNGRS